MKTKYETVEFRPLNDPALCKVQHITWAIYLANDWMIGRISARGYGKHRLEILGGRKPLPHLANLRDICAFMEQLEVKK